MKGKIDRRTFLKTSGVLGIGATTIGFPYVLRGAQPETVKIGGLWPLTGYLATGGNTCMKGAQIAVEEINAAGGIKAINGAKLQILDGDTQSKVDIGMAETERHIRNGAHALIGCFGTDIVLGTTQVSAKYGIPFLADSGVSPDITARGLTHIFKFMSTPRESALAALRDIKRLSEITGVKPKTAVIFTSDTIYGQHCANFTQEYLPQFLDIVGRFKFPPGTKDLTVELTKLKALKPDVMFVQNYVSDGILMTRQMKTLDFNVMAIWGIFCAARCVEEFSKGLGPLAEYQMNSIDSPDYNKEKYKKVAVKYRKITGYYHVPMNAALSYTAIYVFADALERAGSTDKEKVKEALRKTNYNDHILAGGPVIFQKNGQCLNNFNITQQILNGRLENIMPEKYQSTKPVFPMPKWSAR